MGTFGFHVWVGICSICLLVSGLFHLARCAPAPSWPSRMTGFHSFVADDICGTHLLHFCVHLSMHGHLGSFQQERQICFPCTDFFSFGHIWLVDYCIVRLLHTSYVNNGCLSLHSYQQCVRMPLFLQPCSSLLFFVFLVINISLRVKHLDCGFDFQFPDGLPCQAFVHVHVDHLCAFFQEMNILTICSLFEITFSSVELFPYPPLPKLQTVHQADISCYSIRTVLVETLVASRFFWKELLALVIFPLRRPSTQHSWKEEKIILAHIVRPWSPGSSRNDTVEGPGRGAAYFWAVRKQREGRSQAQEHTLSRQSPRVSLHPGPRA